MFDFSKAIQIAIDVGKDLFLGKPEYGYDISTGTATAERPEGGGFLGLIGTGARAYSAITGGDSEGERDEVPLPTYTAQNRYRQRAGTRQTQRYAPTNQLYKDAILRRMRQVNFETNLQRLTEETTVRPTTRRRTPVSPGSAGGTNITRTIAAPSLNSTTKSR